MPWTGVMCNFIDKAFKSEAFHITNGAKVGVDFLYVKDACRFFALLIDKNASGIYNIASGNEVNLLELAEKILQISRSNSEVVNADTGQPENRAVIDIGKLRALDKDLYTTDFNLSLRETIEYYKSNLN